MRIENSNLYLQGSSHTVTSSTTTSQMVAGTGSGGNQGSWGAEGANGVSVSVGVVSSFGKEESVTSFQESSVSRTDSAKFDEDANLSPRDRIRKQVIEQLVARLTMQKSRFSLLGTTVGYSRTGNPVTSIWGSGSTVSAASIRRLQMATTTTTTSESKVTFNAQGTVQTADGRTIKLNLNFNVDQRIARSTTVFAEIERRTMDPLVINFDGPLPEFTDNTISFDLDCDGTPETIHTMTSGSGYLALDKNGNGKIDDGSELFGPNTNNGYAELAMYDEDGNGWIDENDSIFDSLKIWYHDENGNAHLVALKDKNVGAIYLGSVSTGLDMYSGNENTARIRESGLVLLENGESRVMHELDLRI